jgi:hypothetical protein
MLYNNTMLMYISLIFYYMYFNYIWSIKALKELSLPPYSPPLPLVREDANTDSQTEGEGGVEIASPPNEFPFRLPPFFIAGIFKSFI